MSYEPYTIWWVFGAPVCTIVGAIAGHLFTKSRDNAARRSILDREADFRRRQFRKFLHIFRGRMERVDHSDNTSVWAKYIELAPEFKGEAALVSGDFKDYPAFAGLADTVGGWPYENVALEAQKNRTNMRQVICDSIDRLIRCVTNDA